MIGSNAIGIIIMQVKEVVRMIASCCFFYKRLNAL